MRNPIVIVICAILLSITTMAIFAKEATPPQEIFIQDIWIVDKNQSDKWLKFLKEKGGNIRIDDVRIHVYFDREHFNTIWKEKQQQARDDDLN